MYALRIVEPATGTNTTEPGGVITALRAIIAERDQQIIRQGEHITCQGEQITCQGGQIAQLMQQLESLHQQILNLRRMQFGTSSERLAGQAQLFSGTVSLPVPPPSPTIDVSYQRKKSTGRPSLPKDLPRRRIDYDLSAAEKAEFDVLTRIGEEVSETIDYTPPVLTVIEHARAKYRCEKDGESTVRTATAEPSPLPKSNASAGILSYVLVSKFQDHLPFNRQERRFARDGFRLSRSTLCDWSLGAADLLDRLIPPLTAHVLLSGAVGADDTTLPLADPGGGKTRTARLWAYRGGGFRRAGDGVHWQTHPEAVVFEFTESREGLHPMRFLAGFQGYLQADAYAGFDALYRDGTIIEVACWAHARRKVFEVAKSQATPGLAHEALRFIAALYAIESDLKALPPLERQAIRQARSLPLLADFHLWLQGHAPALLPQGPLGKAFAYILGNWTALVRFTECGILAPDNNAVERAIRPIALGRNNWLFAGSARGGRAAATILSLIESCKLAGVEPFAYLKDVLERINSHRVDRLAELLPFNWRPRASVAPALAPAAVPA